MSGVAGRHPECVRAVVGLNTWAWPGAPHFVRFSNFMGGSVGGFAGRVALEERPRERDPLGREHVLRRRGASQEEQEGE